MEDGVESYVAKTEFVCDNFELRLAVIPNRRSRIIGADLKVEEAINRAARVFHVGGDFTQRVLTRLSGSE